MEEPNVILSDGTRVITNQWLAEPTFLVAARNLVTRKPETQGRIKGFVGGHGGDVYWVQHPDDTVAAYGWWEFELVEEQSSFWDHLDSTAF